MGMNCWVLGNGKGFMDFKSVHLLGELVLNFAACPIGAELPVVFRHGDTG